MRSSSSDTKEETVSSSNHVIRYETMASSLKASVLEVEAQQVKGRHARRSLPWLDRMLPTGGGLVELEGNELLSVGVAATMWATVSYCLVSLTFDLLAAACALS